MRRLATSFAKGTDMHQSSLWSLYAAVALFTLSSHGCSDGTVDAGSSCVDMDQDTYGVSCGAGPDCDDTRRSVAPGEAENCSDAVDNNCDGATDEADSQCSASCQYADGDGYHDAGCGGSDCNDNAPDINPSAVESCADGVDNDCDSAADGDDSDCAVVTCVVAAASWQNQALPQAQTGSFEVGFVSTPSRAQMDSVIGLSNGVPAQYADLAAIVRFATTGVIDARNGGSYQADAAVTYAAGVPYEFRMVVDVASRTYDVFVSPDGGAEVALATNYAFRSEQSTVTVLTHWAVTAAVGSQAVCDVTVAGGTVCADVDVCGNGVDEDCSGGDLVCPTGTCDCGSTNALAPCLGTNVTYSAGPSIISFDFQCDGGPCRCGKFANLHDYWVAPATDNGVVSITGMTPASLGTPGAADYRNGWVVNPSSQASVGLDGRFYPAGNHGSPENPTLAAPYVVDTLSGIQSIWKADHYPDADVGTDCNGIAPNGDTRMCFLQTALLTVLSSVPENAGATVLRPAYFGATKTLYSTTVLDLAFLPSLPPPVRPGGDSITADWDVALGNLEFPDAFWGKAYAAVQVHHSKYGWYTPLTNGYRAYAPAERINGALALLMFEANGADAPKKTLLALRAVQQGLDILAIFKHGDALTVNGQPRGSFIPDGGHTPGYYVQALLAAQALSAVDNQWRSLLVELLSTPAGKFITPETSQFTYNATSGKYTYGTYNVAGGPTLYQPNCTATVTTGCQVNSILADPDGNYDDWPEDGVYLDQGAYQAIVWNSTFFAATMIRAIPALRAFAYDGTLAYVRRMVDSGTYVNTASVSPLMPLPRCASGLDVGLVCRDSNDCGGAACDNRQTNFSRLIWPAANTWQHYDTCLDAKTCPGMQGL